MKIRNGFISNSSSASFIVTKDTAEWISKIGVQTIELSEKQIDIIAKDLPSINDIKMPLYLTSYISDGCDEYWELAEYSHSDSSLLYDSGNHGNPYNIDDFVIIKMNDSHWSHIYIRKEHYIKE